MRLTTIRASCYLVRRSCVSTDFEKSRGIPRMLATPRQQYCSYAHIETSLISIETKEKFFQTVPLGSHLAGKVPGQSRFRQKLKGSKISKDCKDYNNSSCFFPRQADHAVVGKVVHRLTEGP